MIELNIVERALVKRLPKAMPLAEALIEAARQQGASVEELTLAMELVDRHVKDLAKKQLVGKLKGDCRIKKEPYNCDREDCPVYRHFRTEKGTTAVRALVLQINKNFTNSEAVINVRYGD